MLWRSFVGGKNVPKVFLMCGCCWVLLGARAEHHACSHGKVPIKNESRRRAEAGRQRRYILSVCGSHDGESTGTCKVFRGYTFNSPQLQQQY